MVQSETPIPMRGRPQPARDELIGDARLQVLDHPLATVLMTRLRDARTEATEFAATMQELTRMLLWTALRETPTRDLEVPGHTGEPVHGVTLAPTLATVALLRAGLGMLPPIRDLHAGIPMYQIGVRRDEATLEPEIYYNNLPASFDGIDHLLVLDPMLATGGSAAAAVRIIREHFSGRLTYLGVIGAPLGVQRLLTADPNITIVLAALDDRLNDRGFIMPGLGDAGDRLFSTS